MPNLMSYVQFYASVVFHHFSLYDVALYEDIVLWMVLEQRRRMGSICVVKMKAKGVEIDGIWIDFSWFKHRNDLPDDDFDGYIMVDL